MSLKFKVLKVLKSSTKVAQFGFDRTTLESVAEIISDNLEVDESATQEEVNTAIATAIEAQLPQFRMMQSFANRQVELQRKKNANKQNAKKEEEEEDEDEDKNNEEPSSSANTSGKDMPLWFKKFVSKHDEDMRAFSETINSIKIKSTTDSRRAQVEEVVKNAGKYGKKVLRDFDRMKFETEDAFKDYLDELAEDVEEFSSKEGGENSAPKLGSPLGKGSTDTNIKVTEAQIDDLVDRLA